jgi:hypothetical protein
MSKSSIAATKADPEHLPARQAAAGDAPARAKRRDALLRFLADPPRDVAEAAIAMRQAAEQYGNDTGRELADLDAGRHPLQRAKAEPSTR